MLDCEQEAGVETEVATVEEKEKGKEEEERTPVHEEEEERIPVKKEDCPTEPVPQNFEME